MLGDTLTTRFTADEVEAVLAYELGHHVHRDLVTGIAVQSSLTLAGFWLADHGVRLMRWQDYNIFDPATCHGRATLLYRVFGESTMTMKASIQAEIEKLDETDLEELHRLILEFVDQRRQASKGNLLTNLTKIRIDGPPDFGANHGLYASGVKSA